MHLDWSDIATLFLMFGLPHVMQWIGDLRHPRINKYDKDFYS